MEKQNYAYQCDVTSDGLYGFCDLCSRFPSSTTEVSELRYCWTCFDREFPGVQAEFKDSDATFKFLGDHCDEEKQSYRQYIVGSCCSVALNFKASIDAANERAFFEITKLYEKSKREAEYSMKEWEKAEEELEDARKEVEKIEESLIDAKAKVELAEQKVDTAEMKIDERTNWCKTVKKRALILAKYALGNDISSDEEPEKKKEENEMHECRLCCNPYGDERPQAAVILCGYKACFNCLSTLPRKVCPHCRAEFTDDKLLKLH